MMKFQEVIEKRHSIREFERKKVPKSVLKSLVKNATFAPSAANTQPWKFMIIDNNKTMEIIRKEYSRFIKIRNFKKTKDKRGNMVYNFYSNLGNCPHIIFIYMDRPKSQNWRFHKLLSISAAIQNILLSATSKNLGSCWMGSFKDTQIEKKFHKILKLKKNEELISGVLIGYPKIGYRPWIRKKKKLSEVLKFV